MELSVEQLKFRYPHSTFFLHVEQIRIAPAECVALVGASGSGKTTLLKLLSGMLLPASGCVHAGNRPLHKLSDAERRAFRIRNLGFVFQDFGLLDYLTVRENILLPARLNSALNLGRELQNRAERLATETGLGELLDRPVLRLSQGERQRVAICRALVGAPKLIFADEPTGNLDPANKQRIFNLLLGQARAAGATLLVVTHDHSFLGGFDRTLPLQDFVQAAA